MRLHTGGRLRRWLGLRLGGDEALGDRAYRRIVHMFGATILVYFLVPRGFLIVIPTNIALVVALLVVVVLELLRHVGVLELPTIREYERRRIGSFVFYSVALVSAVLLFPRTTATIVVLGTALVDPLAGELRLSESLSRTYPAMAIAAYFALAVGALVEVGGWRLAPAAGTAVLLAVIAIGVERPKWGPVDDDLAMTLVPAVVLTLLLWIVPGLPAL